MDKPREKLLKEGKDSLSNQELISIILGSGIESSSVFEISEELLKRSNYNLSNLSRFSFEDLKLTKGIGLAKASLLLSALELGRRRHKEMVHEEIPLIDSSFLAFELIKSNLMDLSHEEFWVIHLNRAGKLIKMERMSVGGVAGAYVDPKIIFKSALALLSSSLILVHNHPSGQLKPSDADKKLTYRIIQIAKLIDIQILDHLIIGNNQYFSFADEKII